VFTFRENYVNSLVLCAGKVQLKQGYFLEYRTNIAPKVPYKAEEKGLFA
jgi:hypothetical protein